MVQWIRLRAPNAGGKFSIPGQGTKILHAIGLAKNQRETNEAMELDGISSIPLQSLLASFTIQSI